MHFNEQKICELQLYCFLNEMITENTTTVVHMDYKVITYYHINASCQECAQNKIGASIFPSSLIILKMQISPQPTKITRFSPRILNKQNQTL